MIKRICLSVCVVVVWFIVVGVSTTLLVGVAICRAKEKEKEKRIGWVMVDRRRVTAVSSVGPSPSHLSPLPDAGLLFLFAV